MQRISTNMPNDDMQYYARMREWSLNRLQNQMASQSRILNLRDDPSGAAHATRHASYLTRLERFSDNIEYATSRHRESEAYLRSSLDILNRSREIALQGAQGTYSADDLRIMATEVNQLINQLVDTGNARGADGAMLFAGDRTKNEPFRTVEGRVAGFDEPVVMTVDYIGTINQNQTEIAEGAYVGLNFPGNEVFWAEDQYLQASVDATTYTVQSDTSVRIDGTDIQLRAGDNVYSIIAKINDAGVAVRAQLDPIQNSLVLQTTNPHQLWLEDEGTVLQDLGILTDSVAPPPLNINSSARLFGGSAFDMLIALRDQLTAGSVIDIGGRAMAGIDGALQNLLSELGELGAIDERLGIAFQRNENEIPEITSRYSNEADVDMTKAITELSMLEYTHRAALGAAGRIIQPTLLDFLR